jgi:hypothetical protein
MSVSSPTQLPYSLASLIETQKFPKMAQTVRGLSTRSGAGYRHYGDVVLSDGTRMTQMAYAQRIVGIHNLQGTRMGVLTTDDLVVLPQSLKVMNPQQYLNRKRNYLQANYNHNRSMEVMRFRADLLHGEQQLSSERNGVIQNIDLRSSNRSPQYSRHQSNGSTSHRTNHNQYGTHEFVSPQPSQIVHGRHHDELFLGSHGDGPSNEVANFGTNFTSPTSGRGSFGTPESHQGRASTESPQFQTTDSRQERRSIESPQFQTTDSRQGHRSIESPEFQTSEGRQERQSIQFQTPQGRQNLRSTEFLQHGEGARQGELRTPAVQGDDRLQNGFPAGVRTDSSDENYRVILDLEFLQTKRTFEIDSRIICEITGAGFRLLEALLTAHGALHKESISLNARWAYDANVWDWRTYSIFLHLEAKRREFMHHKSPEIVFRLDPATSLECFEDLKILVKSLDPFKSITLKDCSPPPVETNRHGPVEAHAASAVRGGMSPVQSQTSTINATRAGIQTSAIAASASTRASNIGSGRQSDATSPKMDTPKECSKRDSPGFLGQHTSKKRKFE